MRLWRPIMADLGRVIEVQVEWSIDDLANAHEALDIREEQERDLRTKE